MQLVLLAISAVLLVLVLRFVVRRSGECRDGLCLVAPHVMHNAVADIGVSMVLLSPREVAQVANLLDVRYPLAEVVVACYAEGDARMWHALQTRYSLVRTVAAERAADGAVRGCYRSRRRCYGQLIVLDMRRPATLDHVVPYCSYDYILAVPQHVHLEEFAVGRMVVALAAAQSRNVLLHVRHGAHLALYPRAEAATMNMPFDVPLAWRTGVGLWLPTLIAVALAALSVVGLLDGNLTIRVAALLLLGAMAALLWFSCCMMSDKDLVVQFAAVVRNFYDDLVVELKKIYYLYLRKH